MKALVFDGSLHIIETKLPQPSLNEALIRVLMSGICNTDLEIIKGYMHFQGILGHEFVGEVVRCNEPSWVGKRVVGEINVGCGVYDLCVQGMERYCSNRRVLGISEKDGTFAEYVTLPNRNLIVVPDTISDPEAVFIEPLAAACEILEQIHIQPIQSVTVVGDGKLAQLIARVLRLTGCKLLVIGKYKEKLSFINRLGIETKLWHQLSGEKFDVVVEASGSSSGFHQALDIVNPRGTLVLKSTIHNGVKLNLSRCVVDEMTLVGSRCGRFDAAVRLLQNRMIEVHDLVSGIYPFDKALDAFKVARQANTLKILLDMQSKHCS